MAKKKKKRLVHPQYKKAKDLPGTGWLIIIAFMLIVMFVMAGLESSGIYEIPKWFIYIYLKYGCAFHLSDKGSNCTHTNSIVYIRQ